MGFVASLIISLVLMVVGELLRPKQNPPNAKASSIDDFQIPTADETRAIPVFVGKCLITGPNVTTYGDLQKKPIKKKVKTGLFSSKMQTIGHKYYMGMQLSLCHGRDDIYCHEIRFGDKMPLNTRVPGTDGLTTFVFNDNNFFGGDESEGGISGVLRFYAGTQTQAANSYFGTKLINISPLPTPAYPGLCHGIMEGMYLGTSPYLKTVAFILSSYPNQLGLTSNRHKIGDDANPICFIYEILTNAVWGLSISPGMIDVASFVAAGNTVATEGYGISMILNGAATAEDVINDILRHIDGVTFTDPTTGLITMKLARPDYVIADLPTFDQSDFGDAGIQFSRASWSQTKNTIKCLYVNRDENFTEMPHTVQDLANIQQRGGEISSEDIDFTGFSSFAAVSLAAARALKTLSYPLAKIEGTLDRRAYFLRPGSVFKLSWPERGIVSSVMRVTKIEYGSVSTNTIVVTAVEDIFSITQAAYVQPPPSGWVDPIGPVTPLARQYAFELPYAMAGLEAPFIATLGSRSNGLDEGYDIHSDRVAPFTVWDYRNRNITFTPSGVLNVAYNAGTAARDPTGFTVNQLIDYEEIAPVVAEDDLLAGASLVLIESVAGVEIVAPKNFSYASGVLTVTDVIRAVYDTAQITHPIGARVWFVSYGYGIENEEPYSGVPRQISVKLLPFNLRSTLVETSATPMLVDLTGRASLPYPLVDVRVNGLVAPTTIYGDAVITWKYRNKYTQAGRVVPGDAATDPLTSGDTFRADIYINNVFVRTITGLTSPTYTYLASDRAIDNANGSLNTRIDVYPYTAGGVSGPKISKTFLMTGFGMTFGQNFGGTQA